MDTAADSGQQVKLEPRAQWRARLGRELREDEEVERAILGEPGGEPRKPRRQRRAGMGAKLKEYAAAHPRRNAEFRCAVEKGVLERVRCKFQEALAARVTEVLGRADGEHADPRDRTVAAEFCQQCQTHRRCYFYRDGFSKRWLETRWGRIRLLLPRVRCSQCGGAVRIAYAQFAPYQRRFEDLREEILGLSALCLSLRQIKAVLDMRGQQLSIATLCKEIGKVADLTVEEFSGKRRVAPVVMLDGVWGHLAEAQEERYLDRRGRERTRKVVKKVPLLVAWGVWPQTGKKALLGWVVGKKEDEESWVRLLELLHGRGVHAERGLRLFVSDGSGGLEAALAMVSFGVVAHQRCVFHKIRNVVRKVRGERVEGDAKATREKRRQRRQEVLADLVLIWGAGEEAEARQQYEAFVAKWREKEPEAVACLENGFEATVVFYQVRAAAAARGSDWEVRYLRTTSLLERANRRIRAKLRASTTFQTEEGLSANVYLALEAGGKGKPGEFRQWIGGVVMRIEELQRAV